MNKILGRLNNILGELRKLLGRLNNVLGELPKILGKINKDLGKLCYHKVVLYYIIQST